MKSERTTNSIPWLLGLLLFALAISGSALGNSGLIYYGNNAAHGGSATNAGVNQGFTELRDECIAAGLPTTISNVFPAALGDLHLFLATAPQDDFTAPQIALLQSLLASGGVIVVSHDGVVHTAQNNLLAALGSTMAFSGILAPGGNDLTTVVDDSHPLMTGLTNGDNLCAFSPGEVFSGSGLVQDSLTEDIISVEMVGGGAIVAVADFDVLNNVPTLFWPSGSCTATELLNIATFRDNLCAYEPVDNRLVKELTSGPDRDGSLWFDDFSDTSGLTLNGSAAQSGSALRLTPAVNGQAGSAFTTNPVNLGPGGSFSTHFSFQISNPGGIAQGDGAGADGLTFTVQNDGAADAALGGGGGNIGYSGIGSSLTVEFDSWDNGGGLGDADGNHVGTATNGTVGNGVATAVGPPRLNDGAVFFAWVDYNGTTDTLEVRLSTTNVPPAAPTLTDSVDLDALLGGTSAHVGFTSGTGAANGDHDILFWHFESAIDLVVPINVLVPTEYDFDIVYNNPDGPPVWIFDTVPAEWDVTHIEHEFEGAPEDLPVDCGDLTSFDDDFGMVDVFRGGKSGKKCNSDTTVKWMPPLTQVVRVYYTERNNATLSVKDLISGSTQVLVPSTGGRLQDVDLDSSTGVLYFADWGPVGPPGGQGSISQVLTDGSGLAPVFLTGDGVHQLALDTAGQLIYFTRAVSYDNHEISVVNYAGGGYSALLGPASFGGPGWFPSGLALDAANSLLYWGDIGVIFNPPNGSVNSMTTAGVAPTQLTPHVTGRGRGFALDAASGTIFLTSHDPLSPGTGGAIHSYDIGTNTESLLISDPGTGYWDVEIDPVAQRIWYTDVGRGEIRSAMFDGTDVVTEVSGLDNPYGLALEISGAHSLNVQTQARCHDNRRNQRCRPTSCGALYLNEGAIAFEKDENGDLVLDVEGEPVVVAGPSNMICLAAVDDVNDDGEFTWDGSGDEDGDNLTDYEEACGEVRTDPCLYDTDGDGVQDDVDDCPREGPPNAGAGEVQDPNGCNRQSECSDGADNDSDGLTDYPDDASCQSIVDDSEDVPDVFSSGTFDVRGTWGIDLDAGSEVFCCAAPTDFHFERVSANESNFDPKNGVTVVLWGASQPTQSDCAGAALAGSAISFFSMTDAEPSDWLCALTDAGRTSSFRLFSADASPIWDAQNIVIDHVTWAIQ